MLNIIDPVAFFLALAVGLLYTYLSTPYPKIVYKFPTPYNAGKITYVDEANVCYKYKVNKVQCPVDKSKITTLKLQESNERKVPIS